MPRKKIPKTRRPRRAPKRSRKRGQSYRMSSSAAVLLARSVSDPWSSSACIPDGARNVGCFSTRGVVSCSTGTTGTAIGFAMGADIGNQYKPDSLSTSATPTFTGNWNPAIASSAIQQQYAAARPVSGGIRLLYNGSDLSNSGTIMVGQVSEKVALSAFNGTNLENAASLCMNYKIFRIRDGARITWSPVDMTDQMDWDLNMSSTVAVTGTVGRPWMIVLGYGLATAGVGSVTIDYVWNYEGQYKQQAFQPGGIGTNTAAPTETGWYEKMQTMLRPLDPILTAIQPVLSNALNAASVQAANYGVTAGLARVRAIASPARAASLPYYMTVD